MLKWQGRGRGGKREGCVGCWEGKEAPSASLFLDASIMIEMWLSEIGIYVYLLTLLDIPSKIIMLELHFYIPGSFLFLHDTDCIC